MRKNFTLLSCSLAAMLFATTGTTAQVSAFPWTETFEDDSPTRSQWTQIYEVNAMSWTYAATPSTGGWTGDSAPYEGSLMANYPATSHDFDKTKLVSPVLDLSQSANASVSFYYRNPYWNPDQNWLRVFYRTSETAEWVELAEFHENITEWTSSGEISLPNLTNTYQIAVECETDYGYSTTVDALTVFAAPLSGNEFHRLSVHYFPNPAKDVLNFNSAELVENISVFNLVGQQVMVQPIGSTSGSLEVSKLSPGHYFVKASGLNGSNVFKLIKQ